MDSGKMDGGQQQRNRRRLASSSGDVPTETWGSRDERMDIKCLGRGPECCVRPVYVGDGAAVGFLSRTVGDLSV